MMYGWFEWATRKTYQEGRMRTDLYTPEVLATERTEERLREAERARLLRLPAATGSPFGTPARAARRRPRWSFAAVSHRRG